MSCFHLALPAKDLTETKLFYENLGFDFGRESDQFLIMDFSGHQVVFHKSDEIPELKMYPRHYGLILDEEMEFRSTYALLSPKQLYEPLFCRFKGKPEEHWTFFLADPSNNLIEFKWYKNKEMVFGK